MGKNRKSNFDKEFSQAIDRMLAGEKIEPYADMPDDYQEAIDFARKLIELKGVPRPSFKVELKDSLLSKLSEMEQEKAGWKRFQERLRHLVPQRPVWRAVAASLTVVVVAGVIWGTGILTPESSAPPPMPAAPPPPLLEVSAVPDQTTYLPEQGVEIQFSFTNIASELVTVSPFPPEIKILLPTLPGRDLDKIVRSFAAGTEELKLEPGETATYDLTWDQHDDQGQQVAPGWYHIEIKHTASKVTQPTRRQSFRGTITKFLIQFPQGAMEKIIEVNQAQTVTDLPFMWKREEYSVDLTITLEQVELTKDRAMFFAFATSPNSPSTGYDHPQFGGTVRAQYIVDGVIKDAGPAGMRYLPNGIGLIWGYDLARLDPVPSDVRELTFTITKFGDWQGPWEFEIPLQ